MWMASNLVQDIHDKVWTGYSVRGYSCESGKML